MALKVTKIHKYIEERGRVTTDGCSAGEVMSDEGERIEPGPSDGTGTKGHRGHTSLADLTKICQSQNWLEIRFLA